MHNRVSERRLVEKHTRKYDHPDRMLAAHGLKVKIKHIVVYDEYTEDVVAEVRVKTRCSYCGSDAIYSYKDVITQRVEKIPVSHDIQGEVPAYSHIERPYKETPFTLRYVPRFETEQILEKGRRIAIRKTPKPFKCSKCGKWNRWITWQMVWARIQKILLFTGFSMLLGPVPLTILVATVFRSTYSDAQVVSTLGLTLLVLLILWLFVISVWSLVTYYSPNPEDMDPPELHRLPSLRVFVIYYSVTLGLSCIGIVLGGTEGIVGGMFAGSTFVALVFPFTIVFRSYF